MTDPLTRWHLALTACTHNTARPCGWCLWRAGYRGPRPPDRVRAPRAPQPFPRFPRTEPAGSRQLEMTMTDTDTTTARADGPHPDAWRVRFSTTRHDAIIPAADAKSARKAATIAAERAGSGGAYRVSVIREVYGMMTGRAYTYDVSVVMEPRVVISDVGTGADIVGDAGDGGGE